MAKLEAVGMSPERLARIGAVSKADIRSRTHKLVTTGW
jgi:hypothetical protein